jgi:hypothetical protein
MQLMCSELTGRSRRITIGAGTSEEGPRLGGRAPQECVPSSRALRYIVTFPLTADGMEEASLFADPDPDFVFGGNAGKVLQGPQLEVIRHPRSRRCGSSPKTKSWNGRPGTTATDVLLAGMRGRTRSVIWHARSRTRTTRPELLRSRD